MPYEEWNTVIVALICLGVAALLLVYEERPTNAGEKPKGEWMKRWVLARFLLLIAAVTVMSVWFDDGFS